MKKCINPNCKNSFPPTRSDKKYCSSKCRAAHYNRTVREEPSIIRETLKILHNNHKVLQRIHGGGKAPIIRSKDFLLGAGFVFNMMTGTRKIKGESEPVVFLYDYGIIEREPDMFEIIYKKIKI